MDNKQLNEANDDDDEAIEKRLTCTLFPLVSWLQDKAAKCTTLTDNEISEVIKLP